MLTLRFSYLCWMRVSFVTVWFTIFTVGNLCRRVSRRLETSACPASMQRNPHLMAHPPRRLLNIFHQAKIAMNKMKSTKKTNRQPPSTFKHKSVEKNSEVSMGFVIRLGHFSHPKKIPWESWKLIQVAPPLVERNLPLAAHRRTGVISPWNSMSVS